MILRFDVIGRTLSCVAGWWWSGDIGYISDMGFIGRPPRDRSADPTRLMSREDEELLGHCFHSHPDVDKR